MPTTLVETIEKTAAEEVAEKMVMKGAKMDVGSFSIKRDQAGLVVNIKSDKLETFFKNLSGGQLSADTAGRKYHKITSADVREGLMMSTEEFEIDMMTDSPNIFSGRVVNLSCLRAVGITDGLELKFPGVYSRPMMAKLSKALKYTMSRLYTNFMKPYEHACQIQTIEYYTVEAVQP